MSTSARPAPTRHKPCGPSSIWTTGRNGVHPAKAAEAAEELGKQDFFTGDMKAAEAALRRAIALNPKRSSAYEALVGILGLQGKGEEAKAILDRMLEKEPDEETLKALADAVGG